MSIYVLAILLGVVAGLRAMIVPAALSWAAHIGVLNVAGTWLSFLGNAWVPWFLTALAVGELITDQLPSTPSRTVPMQFGARILIGALAGVAVGVAGGDAMGPALFGAVGAVAGTLGGRAARGRLAYAFGRDRPAALIEDVVAIVGAALLVTALA